LFEEESSAQRQRYNNVFISPMADLLFHEACPEKILQRCLDRDSLTYEEVLALQEEIHRKHGSTIQIPEKPKKRKAPSLELAPLEPAPPEPAPPELAPPEAPWTCVHCTFENPPLYVVCGVCLQEQD
jgi:hypothetical protein